MHSRGAVDEYGELPGDGGQKYATMDTVIEDSDSITTGTMPHANGMRHYMGWNRGLSSEEYAERWDRAFAPSRTV